MKFGILHKNWYEIVSFLLPGSGFCPEATAKMVSATNKVGIFVFGSAECNTILPSKWPPQIAAVRPGKTSVYGSLNNFKVAEETSFLLAQTESTSVMYTGH